MHTFVIVDFVYVVFLYSPSSLPKSVVFMVVVDRIVFYFIIIRRRTYTYKNGVRVALFSFCVEFLSIHFDTLNYPTVKA